MREGEEVHHQSQTEVILQAVGEGALAAKLNLAVCLANSPEVDGEERYCHRQKG